MLRQQIEQALRSQQERDQLLAEMRGQLATREAQSLNSTKQCGDAANAGRISEANSGMRSSLRCMRPRTKVFAASGPHWSNNFDSRREQLTALQAQQHKVEVTAARLRHERQTLAERMQDDYGIELETAEASAEQKAGFDVGPGSRRAGNCSASRSDQQHRGHQPRGAR